MDDLTTIIRDSLHGDEFAFAKLVSRYQDTAVGYAYSLLGDFHLAQDAAQEAFLAVHRDLAALDEPKAFPGWLRKIVFKYCDRIKRRRALPSIALANAPEIIDHSADLEQAYIMSQTRLDRDRQVSTALQCLTEADRTVITLFYMGEHSAEEIGVFLQLSQAAVKKRLQRARERLKERMLEMLGQSLSENVPSKDARFVEAAVLMRRAATILENDPRVEAAWLADSFGQSGDNGWSSAWLQVVVKDEDIDSFILGCRENASRLAEPLLFGIGPQNAPPGGAYCAALYDGESGPYEINWYWQPASGASIPTGTVIPSEETRPVTHVLFNRGGIPFSGEVLRCEYNRNIPATLQQRFDSRSEEEVKRDDIVGGITHFWFMLLISARWIGGAPNETEPRLLEYIRTILAEVQGLLGVEAKFPPSRAYTGIAPKLSILREAASIMEQLMPAAAGMSCSGAAFNPAIVSRTYRFLDMIEQS